MKSFTILGLFALTLTAFVITINSSGLGQIDTEFKIKKLRLFDWEDRSSIELSKFYSYTNFFPIQIENTPEDVKLLNKNAFVQNFRGDYLGLYSYPPPFIPVQINLPHNISFPVAMVPDEKNKVIYIGDSGNKQVLKIDYFGKVIEEYPIGIHFLSFNYSPTEEKFIFYSPMQVLESDQPVESSIIITNSKMKILHNIFPINPSFLSKVPISRQSFKTLGSRTFFNPPFSSEIYELFYNGTYKKIFDLYPRDKDEIKNNVLNIPSIDKNMNQQNSFSLNESQPIADYLVGKNELIIEKYINGIRYNLIIEKGTGRCIIISPKVALNNFGQGFRFAFKAPKYVSESKFIAYISNKECYEIKNAFISSGTSIPDYLENATKNQCGLIMDHSYNFNYIYDHSKDDIRPLFADFNYSSQLNDANNQLLFQQVKLFPNPASETINIQFKHLSSPETIISLSLLDVWGNTLMQQKVAGQDGLFRAEFNLQELIPGNYFISIYSKEQRELFQFVVN